MGSFDWSATSAIASAISAIASGGVAIVALTTMRREARRAATEQATARRAQTFREMVRVYEAVDSGVSRLLGRLRRWQSDGSAAAAWRIHDVSDDIQHSVHLLTLHRAPNSTVAALADVADEFQAVVGGHAPTSRLDGLLALLGRNRPTASELVHLEELHVVFLREAQGHLEEIWPKH